MKKILLGIIFALLAVMAYATIANGYSIGNMTVLSLSGIKEKNDELDQKIEEAQKLKTVSYVNKLSDLNSAAKDLIKEKKSYEELVTYSSQEDIEKANQSEKYEVEVLWANIGLYATKNGVTLKFDIVESSTNTPNSNDLKFVATGSYISITDFISDLEKDAKLAFTISNFTLVPTSTNDSSGGMNLQATFKVNDISLNLNTTKVGGNTTTTNNNNSTSKDSSNNSSTNN